MRLEIRAIGQPIPGVRDPEVLKEHSENNIRENSMGGSILSFGVVFPSLLRQSSSTKL